MSCPAPITLGHPISNSISRQHYPSLIIFMLPKCQFHAILLKCVHLRQSRYTKMVLESRDLLEIFIKEECGACSFSPKNQMLLFSLYHFRRPNETNWTGLPTIILKRKSWKTNHKLRKRISFGSWHMSKLLSNEQGGRWVKPPTTYLPCRWRLKYWVLQWINLCFIMSYYFTDPLG